MYDDKNNTPKLSKTFNFKELLLAEMFCHHGRKSWPGFLKNFSYDVSYKNVRTYEHSGTVEYSTLGK